MYSLLLTFTKKQVVQNHIFSVSNELVVYQTHIHGFTTLFQLAKITLEQSTIYGVTDSMTDFCLLRLLRKKRTIRVNEKMLHI